MKKRNELLIIFSIFLFVVLFRLFYVFQVDSFTGDQAYFHLRDVENIVNTGDSIEYDEYSYGGKEVLYPPGFHYFLSFFGLFMDINLVGKVIPEIIFGILVFIVFYIAKEITKDTFSSLMASISVGFLPLYVRETINKVSVYSLALPIIFLMFYLFIKITDNKKYILPLIVSSLFLSLIHPIAFIFISTLIFYWILMTTEDLKLYKIRKEVMLFLMLLIVLLEFILYKKAFLEYGINFIWGNVPEEFLSTRFIGINLLSLIYNIGIFTLIMGSFGLFFGIFRQKSRCILLFGGLILSVLLMMLLKLIDFKIGSIFLGISLAIMSSITIKRFIDYVRITKFSKYKNIFYIMIFFLVIFSSVIPSIGIARSNISNSITDGEVEILNFIETRTNESEVILTNLKEGNIFLFFVNRTTVVDTNFLLAPNVDERVRDINLIYNTPNSAIALSLIRKYDINYVYLSKRSKMEYGIEDLRYIEDRNCFDRIEKIGGNLLYEITC